MLSWLAVFLGCMRSLSTYTLRWRGWAYDPKLNGLKRVEGGRVVSHQRTVRQAVLSWLLQQQGADLNECDASGQPCTHSGESAAT